MRKLTASLLAFSAGLFFISCNKEAKNDLSTAINIVGNYKLVSMTADTRVTQQTTSGSDVDKSITVSKYTTTNNTGTVKIDAGTMAATNMSYDVNTTAMAYFYTNGVLTDSAEMPFQFHAPASSSTAAYKMAGNDSLYFSSGSIFMNGTTQSTMPSGAKLKMEGDKLYMTVTANQTSTQDVQGTPVLSIQQATTVVTLQKQ